jgi:hypothetical protein
MSKKGHDDFYVGYMKQAAPELAQAVRMKIAGLFAVIVLAAVGFALTQKPMGNGVFEYGKPQWYKGVVAAEPYPSLMVMMKDGAFVRHHLVGFGKFGADVAAFDRRAVTLEATFIYRDGQHMLEIVPGTVSVIKALGGEAVAEPLGTHTFVGEIVDSKCYLGVMNPGNLKTHKACAIRCISGGVPPVLLVRDDTGMAVYLMLVSPDGKAVNDLVLDMVAEPLEITGEVERRDNLYYLKADPNSYRRMH